MIAILILPAVLSLHAAKPVFDSKYTGAKMMEDCQSPEDDPNGGDPPEKCPGFGPYTVTQHYSASTTFNLVEYPGHRDFQVALTPEGGSGSSSSFPGAKIEWRLHDGKPFAVINRMKLCDVIERDKCKEYLLVRGLFGHEKIHGDIDASKPNANAAARKLADDGFDLK